MNPIVRIVVKETAGIRRFLYPLSVSLNRGLPAPSPGEQWQVCESGGAPLPTQICGDSAAPEVAFALSMAPYEERELFLARSHQTAAIPDAIHLEPDSQGGFFSRQERLVTHVGARTGLDSVVYDGIEHLAGPLTVSLSGREAALELRGTPAPNSEGLVGAAWFTQAASAGDLSLSLTACKSWVTATYTLPEPAAGQTVLFRLPLKVLDPAPICDFGVGEGVYEKIGGDAVVWSTELAERPYARWQIGTLAGGELRRDYEGEIVTPGEFAPRAWFHFVERAKALAVAILAIPSSVDRMQVSLGRDGLIEIAFVLAPRSTPGAARFSVCYHFLNDIPAIAAATNPASILLPPDARISAMS